MRLSVKAPNGRVELFDEVHTMSFLDLRIAVIERFALENDFSLMCGSQELPRDAKTRVVSSEVGLVSGDRLRLVIHDKALEERERITLKSIAERSNESNEMLSSSASERVSNSSEMRNDNENAIVSLIIDEMSKCGFYCKRLAIDGSRLLFRHAESVLSAEIDFHHYVDARSKCSHITVSVVHPAKRQFLPPVVLDEGAKNLRQFAIEHIVSPIQIALLGHENAFLRLLGNEAIAERIMKELPAKSVLRLECTCVHANKACNGSFKDRLWLFLLHRDFGDAVTPMNNESSRDAYQRLFVEREKERQRSLTRELEFHCRHPILSDPPRHPQPIPPYMPFRPDPDIPEGPFYPQPSNPFYPPENPFPGVPGFGPSRPRNPLDPFSGSELMPSRPRRPGGLPRQLPDGHSPFSGGFGGAGFI